MWGLVPAVCLNTDSKETNGVKEYQEPRADLLLFSSDPIMASDENELAIDKLASIFDL